VFNDANQANANISSINIDGDTNVNSAEPHSGGQSTAEVNAHNGRTTTSAQYQVDLFESRFRNVLRHPRPHATRDEGNVSQPTSSIGESSAQAAIRAAVRMYSSIATTGATNTPPVNQNNGNSQVDVLT